MFSQNNYMRDGHSRVSSLFGQVNRSRFVIPILGLINILLLVIAVVLGVYCSKSKEQYLQPLQSAEHLPYILELNYLRENHSSVIKATKEAEDALKTQLAAHEGIKQLLKKQNGENDGLQSQIEHARVQKKKLLVSKVHMGKSCGRCLEGWVLLNSSCYFFSSHLTDPPKKKNWRDGRQDCIDRKADLVMIETWEKQQLLNDNMPRYTGSVWWSNGFWMGLTDITADNTWVWINNVTRTAPFYWVPGEPNRSNENCAGFYPSGDATATWFDALCGGHELYWMCEMKPNEQ